MKREDENRKIKIKEIKLKLKSSKIELNKPYTDNF
jgi:hypothetical protein